MRYGRYPTLKEKKSDILPSYARTIPRTSGTLQRQLWRTHERFHTITKLNYVYGADISVAEPVCILPAPVFLADSGSNKKVNFQLF